MVSCLHNICCLLILQIYVRAAPNNITNVEELILKDEEAKVAKLEEIEQVPDEPKLDSTPLLIEESHDDNSTQSLRQKRFYNFYGFGAPPINPVVYPSYNKRDQSAETGVYGLVEDPLEHIHRRLHDIASFVRQPVPLPPPPSHFPFFFPVIYIPQYECECSSNNDNTTPTPQPVNPQTPNPEKNQTDPDPDKRFPDLSDDRLNWGILSNDTNTQFDEVNEDDYARPISFVPLNPNRPMGRPAPPVEHGSSQGNSADTPQVTTTVSPTDTERRPTARPPPSQPRPISSPRPPAPYPPSLSNDIPQTEQPSPCDVAVLSCCHRLHVTYDCFVAQGCLDPAPYGNLCDPLAILQVIEKFQKFYGVRDEN